MYVNKSSFLELNRRKFLGAAASALALPVTGSLPALGSDTSLAIGMANSVMTVTYPYITTSLAHGFFEEEGVNVDVVMGQNSSQILSLLAGGTVDLVFCNPEPVIQLAADKNVPVKSVFVVLVAQYILTVPEGSPIQTVKDLKGKRIGMASPVSGIDYLKARLMDEGMSVDDIEIVPTGFGGQTIEAVKQGQVDAIMYWSDALALFRYSGLELRNLPKADWEQGLYQYVAATRQDVIDTKPEALKRALRAMARSQMLSVVSPKATIDAFWKQYPDQAPKAGEEEAAFGQALARVRQQNTVIGIESNPSRETIMSHQWGKQELSSWDRMQENLLRVGSLKNKVDPATLFDDQFSAYANDFDREQIYELAAAAE
ncbi:MAG: NrtA/SsuA/CpmA family ABC transporter substrate-binding protein [Rhizobiaceae bacterium]|nr:NrtA/SsuA/CpmA family ABC transporter substrate-binding protein [Rhizobiaceae bacterium]